MGKELQMGKLSITKKFEFSSAHYLPYHKGACLNPHGHNYILEVEVSQNDGLNIYGEGGEETGMIMDFSRLKEIVNKYIINKLDHTNLNNMFENPTAEILVDWITTTLLLFIPNLSRVKLYETSSSYAEWRGN